MGTGTRKPEIVVISDLHLGTFGCHGADLADYLSTVSPGVLILNGDFIDIWQFRKHYFPASHTRVAHRKYAGFTLSGLTIENKLVIEVDGKVQWFFHGDVFDLTLKHSKWLARLGSHGYDLVILLNRFVNAALEYSEGSWEHYCFPLERPVQNDQLHGLLPSGAGTMDYRMFTAG